MNDKEKNVLEFLKTGMIYSDSAICKNLGITQSELEKIYNNLLIEGYLETYENFFKRELEKEECNNCGKSCNSTCCKSSDDDFSNIKVLTDKAFTYTS